MFQARGRGLFIISAIRSKQTLNGYRVGNATNLLI